MPEGMTPEERKEFIQRIVDLSHKVDVSEEQREATRLLAEDTRAIAEEAHSATVVLRVVTGVCVVLIVALIAGGVYLRGVVQDNRETASDVASNATTTCENANKTRAGQRAIWQFFFEVTEAGAGPDAPEAVIEFYHAFLAWIEGDVLPDRDCQHLDREYPAPGPPPSYEQALKEALADEAREDRRP